MRQLFCSISGEGSSSYFSGLMGEGLERLWRPSGSPPCRSSQNSCSGICGNGKLRPASGGRCHFVGFS